MRTVPELLVEELQFADLLVESHQQWLVEARHHEHTPESIEFCILSFIFEAKKPFHPEQCNGLPAARGLAPSGRRRRGGALDGRAEPPRADAQRVEHFLT